MIHTHAVTYKGFGISKFVHRARLKKILKIFGKLNLERKKDVAYADFGCSDGFIISYLKNSLGYFNNWAVYGFDYEDKLLNLAKERSLLNSIFIKFDLNKINKNYQNLFDVVTSFETIEHTGNYKNAFDNIYLSCKPGGVIFISVPNEIGLPGIIKFIGRKVLKRNVYGNFFKGASKLKYLLALVTGKDIEAFRSCKANGWGPHLGFNYRNFEKYILDEYVKKDKVVIYQKEASFLGFNLLYVLEKCK